MPVHSARTSVLALRIDALGAGVAMIEAQRLLFHRIMNNST